MAKNVASVQGNILCWKVKHTSNLSEELIPFLAKERLDFRELFFNEFVFRIASSIYKIKLIADALHKHNEYKDTKFLLSYS